MNLRCWVEELTQYLPCLQETEEPVKTEKSTNCKSTKKLKKYGEGHFHELKEMAARWSSGLCSCLTGSIPGWDLSPVTSTVQKHALRVNWFL